VTTWTGAEVADAGRDVIALLRAQVAGSHGDIDAVLDSAGDRGVRAVAETFLGLSADLIARLTFAVLLIEDDQTRELPGTVDYAAIMADPDLRQAVEENVARLQAGIITGG
jgi:hypothetical protein